MAPTGRSDERDATRGSRLAKARDFGVVIPILDLPDNFEACLWSLFSQEGDFSLHVHVQDGGDGDDCWGIFQEVAAAFSRPRFTTSYRKQKDFGAADAINLGLKGLNATMVSWLGADDMLMPGALQAIFSLRARYPHVRWVTGLPHLISQDAIGIPSYGSAGFYRWPLGFSREAIRRGLHAGEWNHGFIQQEGTFWEKKLWDEVGGLDSNLTLAFDFSLWCKLADRADLFEIVMPLGAFRKRPGQASSNMSSYQEQAASIRREIASQSRDKRLPMILVDRTNYALWDTKEESWVLGSRYFHVWVYGSQKPFTFPIVRGLRDNFVALLRRAGERRVILRFFIGLIGLARRRGL